MPFRASLDFSRWVQAKDESGALKQACLCIDRDLEEILAHVNTMNVSEVLVELRRIESAKTVDGELWNTAPFDENTVVPRYIVVRDNTRKGATRA